MSENTFKENRLSNLISGVLLIVLSVMLWWQSGSFPGLDEGYPGPNLFPRIIAIGLGSIGLFLIISNFHNKAGDGYRLKIELSVLVKPLLAVLIVIVFPFLTPKLGFILTLLVLTILIGFVFQLNWWKALCTGFITVGIVYLIFSQLLGVLL